jgi:hypothetical protein
MPINSSEQAIVAINTAIREGTPFDKITAIELNQLLRDIFTFLSSIASSGLVGAAIPSTNPGIPVGKRMWVASTPGTYNSFGGIVIGNEEAAFLVDNGTAFEKVTIPIDLTALVQQVFIGTPGRNLYNSAATTSGYLINYSNGAITTQASSIISDYIAVLPSTTYTISGRVSSSGGRGVAYYDSSKTLINTPTGSTTWGDGALNGQYTTTANTYYMRITVKYAGYGDPNVVMVEKGNEASEYEAYYTVIENLGSLPIAASIIDTDLGKMTPLEWALAKGFSQVITGQLPQTVNLFNSAAVLAGYHINNTTGLLSAQSGSSTSDYISVIPSTDYYISGRISSSGTRGVAYYNSDKVFINVPTGVSTWGDGPLNGVYSTTADTYFIRITSQFAGTGDLSSIQVEKGSHPTTYVSYQSYNAITKVNGVEVYPNDAKVLEKVNVLIANKWTGKKICWMGTSIPAGYPSSDKEKSYPNLAAAKLGANIINESLASSLVRIATSAGLSMGSTFDGVSFGKTGAELTAGGYSAANSYESKMLSHLDADLFVFDFGFNDFSADSTNFNIMPSNAVDRNTFIGSMNYCIYRLLEQKPRARIALFGHYENQYRPLIASAQQVIADYWQAYLFKTWERTNWSQRLVPPANTTSVRATWLTDGIHPNSDTSGAATALLSNLAEAFILSL